jgi:hypothetical protein
MTTTLIAHSPRITGKAIIVNQQIAVVNPVGWKYILDTDKHEGRIDLSHIGEQTTAIYDYM